MIHFKNRAAVLAAVRAAVRRGLRADRPAEAAAIRLNAGIHNIQAELAQTPKNATSA